MVGSVRCWAKHQVVRCRAKHQGPAVYGNGEECAKLVPSGQAWAHRHVPGDALVLNHWSRESSLRWCTHIAQNASKSSKSLGVREEPAEGSTPQCTFTQSEAAVQAVDAPTA